MVSGVKGSIEMQENQVDTPTLSKACRISLEIFAMCVSVLHINWVC